jgi:hypothetical protein
MSVTAVSTDSAMHNVQVYSDISAEWVTGDLNKISNWTTTVHDDFITHKVQLSEPTPFGEVNDHTECE